MGRDKALLEVGGESLLLRTVRVLRETGLDAWVVGRDRPPGWGAAQATFVPDDDPGAGPVAGLASAWRRVDAALCTVPCDAPALTPHALAWLLRAGADGGVVALDGRPQLAIAVWPAAARSVLLAYAAEGRRSLAGAVERAGLPLLAPSAALAADFRQANTPEEWAALVPAPATSGHGRSTVGQEPPPG